VAGSPLRKRRFVLLVVLLCGFGVVLFRLVSLQVLQAAELTVKADRQHQKTVSLEGARGTIVDRHGKVLALNMDVPSVFGVPTALESPARTARTLSPVLHVRAAELEKKLRQDRSFVWLARKLDPEQGHRLEQMPMEGIGTVLEGRRFYPKGPLLAHVLGFAGMDGTGLEGLERRYESHLHGEKRVAVLQRDALGRVVFPKGEAEQNPASGHSLTLTIDEVIQYIAEKELEEAMNKTRAKAGTVIVLDAEICRPVSEAAKVYAPPWAFWGSARRLPYRSEIPPAVVTAPSAAINTALDVVLVLNVKPFAAPLPALKFTREFGRVMDPMVVVPFLKMIPSVRPGI